MNDQAYDRIRESIAASDLEPVFKTELISLLEVLIVREQELTALMASAKAVLGERGFVDSARAIFDHCRGLIGATSGYVALLTDDGQENEVLFLEAGGLPCEVNPDLPMPIRGLRARAYKENRAVFHNNFMKSGWVRFMPKGHVILHNVLFAPLIIKDRTVGIMGLANKEGDFTPRDADMATGFGELASIALQNSREQDNRVRAEAAREKTIQELRRALDQVKTLSGLLPICSHCKKIRDDKGYWNRIDTYIQAHSQATFSHGICQDCQAEFYPELGLSGESESDDSDSEK